MAATMLGDALRKTFLAGVGALSLVGEKGEQVVSSLVERGEQAVTAGRDLNQELTHAVSDVAADTREGLLKTRIELMTPEERASFVEAVQRVSAQVQAEQEAHDAARGHQPAPDPAPEASRPDDGPIPVHVHVTDPVDAAASTPGAGCGCAGADR